MEQKLQKKVLHFVRSNLDYADTIYDKPLNEPFKRKTKMVQYNAALIITGAFKGPGLIKYTKSFVWNFWQIEDRLENVSSQNNLRIIIILP